MRPRAASAHSQHPSRRWGAARASVEHPDPGIRDYVEESLHSDECMDSEEEWCGSDSSSEWEADAQEAVWLFCQDPFGHWRAQTPRVFEHYGIAAGAKAYAVFSIAGILAAAGIVIISTLRALQTDRDSDWLFVTHTAFAGWFTLDVLVRLAAAPSKMRDFVQNVTCMLDVAAVLPAIVTLIATRGEHTSLKYFDLLVLRVVRLLELVTRMDLSSEMQRDLEDLKTALKQSQYVLILYLCILVVVLVVWSTAVYYVERLQHTEWDEGLELLIRRKRLSQESHAYGTEFDPEVWEVSPFGSIIECVWWALTTLATVGYGDTVPISAGAKVVAGVTMISGIFVLALPTSILGSNFICLHRARYAKLNPTPPGVGEGARGDEDAELMAQVWEGTEYAVGKALLTPEQAEFIRRACWCDEYRRRVAWVYRAATGRSDLKLRSVKAKLRFVGLYVGHARVVCPEVAKQFRRPGLLTNVREGEVGELAPDTYITFEVDVGLGYLVHRVRPVDQGFIDRARGAVRYSSVRAWCEVHQAYRTDADDDKREMYAMQRGYHATLARLDRKRGRRLARLLSVFLRYVERVSSTEDAAHPHLRTASLFKPCWVERQHGGGGKREARSGSGP